MTGPLRGEWTWLVLVTFFVVTWGCNASQPKEQAAREQAAANQSEGRQSKDQAKTIEGCIFLGDRTVLQSRAGVTYELVGERARFQPYEGQLVEVVPAEVGSGASVDLTKLSAGEIRAVNTQCPFSPTAMPGSDSQAGSSASQSGTNLEQPNAATPQYASPGAPNQDSPHLGRDPNKAGASGGPSPGTGNPPRQ